MKPIVILAAALVLLIMAAPATAGAFTNIAVGERQNLTIDVNSGSTFYFGGNRFYGQMNYFGRSYKKRRNNGYGNFQNHYILPARAIVRSLRAREFCYISRPRLKRGFYRVRAQDAYGRRVRLLIDPYNGAIIRLRYR